MPLLRCNSPILNISVNGAQNFSLFLKFVTKCDCLENGVTEAGEKPDANEYTYIFSVMISMACKNCKANTSSSLYVSYFAAELC